MFNKRSLPDEAIEELPPEKRLRHDVVDIFLNNNLSAARSARMIENVNLAGAAGLEDMQVSRGLSRRKTFRNSKMATALRTQGSYVESENTKDGDPDHHDAFAARTHSQRFEEERGHRSYLLLPNRRPWNTGQICSRIRIGCELGECTLLRPF